MKPSRRVVAVAMLAFAGATAAQKTCSKADEANAAKAIDRVTSWATLSSTWKTYRHCDTGAVGENFTEAILRLVVDWKGVNQLADAMKDPDYNQFILAHLKSPEAKADAPDVYSRAKAQCPKGLEAFCKDIAAAVHEAPPPPPPTPVAMPPIRTPQPGVPPPTPPAEPAQPGKK